jgi:hypothetical protein
LLGAVIKILNLLRYNHNVGRLVILIGKVFSELGPFLSFYLGWIIIFSLFYQMLGFSIEKNIHNLDYFNLWDYVISSWKIGTKGSG